MKKGIIGGIISLVIGGTGFALSKTDIVNNFASNTGMSQQQAQQYVENAQGNLVSFSVIGSELVEDGSSALNSAKSIDCNNYTYEWVSDNLSCAKGKIQLQTMGNNEVSLGNCYKALDTDLGDTTKAKMSECTRDIDALNTSFDFPIAVKMLDQKDITEQKNSNNYNKSVLQAALK